MLLLFYRSVLKHIDGQYENTIKKSEFLNEKKGFPEEIILGKAYKNFRGYEGVVLYVFEHEKTTKVIMQ